MKHCRGAALAALVLALLALGTSRAAAQYATSLEDRLDLGMIFLVLFAIFLIPSIVAFVRRHPNRWPILLINVLLGGTGLGWFGALIWACGAVHRSPTGNHGGESGLNLFVNDPKTMRIENPQPARTDASEIGERLLRLKQLHDQDAISQQEYERLKKPLLDSLS